MANPAQQPRGRCRPWPKKFDGMRFVIDREKLRDEFLRNPHYKWEDFCTDRGYKADARTKKEFPVKAWQQAWLQQQVEHTEDTLMKDAANLRHFIAQQRLEFPRQWERSAQAMKGLADFILERELRAARWDKENEEAILKDPTRARCHMKPSNLAFLASAQKTIQEIHRNALLLPPPGEAYKATIPIRETDPEVLDAEQEEQRLREIPVGLIGGGTLDEGKMTQILDRWIDQNAKAAEADKNLESLDDQDQPIDPL